MSFILPIVRGATFDYVGTLRVLINDVPQVDYTGWTIEGNLFNKKVEFTEIDISWIDITQGIARLRISSSITADMDNGVRYTGRIWLTTPAGDRIPSPAFFLDCLSARA
jgi:hypothetical protein